MECAKCPSLDEKGDKCAVGLTAPCCADCGCSLGLKLRVLSAGCPKGKWGAVVDKNAEREIKKQILEDKDASNI